MQSLVLVILLALLGGIAVGIQSPLASLISQRLGLLESVFIVHLGGALCAAVPLILRGGGQLSAWQRIPSYICFGNVALTSRTWPANAQYHQSVLALRHDHLHSTYARCALDYLVKCTFLALLERSCPHPARPRRL